MAHIHEKIDFTSSIYIVQDGKVLLHKHKKLGIWLPPGGHIELDEDPNQAALCEAKEETGLEVEIIGNPRLVDAPKDGSKDLIPPMFVNRHNFNETHENVDMVYFARPVGGTVQAEEAGGEVEWLDEDAILKNEKDIRDGVRSYALAALRHFQNKKRR
jgi:ADP-ribose pyrophosphatase YjhB (NUDIX family)